MKKHVRRLPVKNPLNARELGGYPVPGGMTRYGVFVRSARPWGMTEADKEYMRDYGIKVSIDFRGGYEREMCPSDLSGESWIGYHTLPLFNEKESQSIMTGDGIGKMKLKPWGQHYIDMAEMGKAWVKKCFEICASADGAVHFHCHTGKDRTGAFAALLLGVAGAEDEDIIADYCVSQIYLMPIYREMTHLFGDGETEPDASNFFFKTEPENMKMYLTHLREAFGGVREYVRACGVAEETIEAVRAKFIEE